MELTNKTILFLGSSVTYGSASGGISFADLMAERCGIRMIKEALSGTTLADVDSDSYVSRLKLVDRRHKPDLVIVQLSTNDSGRGIPLEQTEDAIRWITSYVKDTWHCPIAFYTGTYFDRPTYAQTVNRLLEIKDECGFLVIDLWNDPTLRAVSDADYKRYMADPVHPTLYGYKDWWTPKFIEFCRGL